MCISWEKKNSIQHRILACMGEIRHVYILAIKSEKERLIVRFRHRWEGNIKMNLEEIWWKNFERIYMLQHGYSCRLCNATVMNIWVPQRIGNFSS
jgi:hypothetical protein